jgi:hypothetical protein
MHLIRSRRWVRERIFTNTGAYFAYRHSTPEKGILINKLVTLEAEVQFGKKDMARNIDYSSHRCMLDGIFCGKTEGVESDASE